MCLFLRRAGGPFKPFFGLSGALLKRKLSSCLGTETISRVRADALRHLLLLPSSPLVHDAHPRANFEGAVEGVPLSFELCLYGYVVMPEHVHLLISEPPQHTLA